jgi:hypothetical protein
MTRKDYVLIADTVYRASLTNPSTAHRLALCDFAILMASQLAADNPRFDRDRFIAACMVQS